MFHTNEPCQRTRIFFSLYYAHGCWATCLTHFICENHAAFILPKGAFTLPELMFMFRLSSHLNSGLTTVTKIMEYFVAKYV